MQVKYARVELTDKERMDVLDNLKKGEDLEDKLKRLVLDKAGATDVIGDLVFIYRQEDIRQNVVVFELEWLVED